MFLASNQVAVHDPRLRKVHESWQVELSSVSLYMGKSFNTKGGLCFSFFFLLFVFCFSSLAFVASVAFVGVWLLCFTMLYLSNYLSNLL